VVVTGREGWVVRVQRAESFTCRLFPSTGMVVSAAMLILILAL
jgi:hypothetical protein